MPIGYSCDHVLLDARRDGADLSGGLRRTSAHYCVLASPMTYDEIIVLIRDRPDNHVVRIRWTSGDGSAIVTTGELREALADCAIDTAEIESLEFLSVH
jgi:hypothetical protein